MATRAQTGLLGPSRSGVARSTVWETATRGLRHRPAMIGLGLVLALTGAAAGAGWLAPHDPVASDLGRRLLAPSAEYPLGTDWIGRCLLSRLLYGLRLTVLVGVVTVLAGGGLGVALGLVAGFYGRLWETVIMRATDLLLSFPYFLLTIVLVAVLGASLLNAMVAIAVWTMPHFVRVVRAVTLSLREREFVEAARALGRTEPGILLRHVLPGCAAPLVVQASVFCAQNMLMSASLSFLGLGAQPPSPELGAMLAAGRTYLRVAPQVVVVPAVGILLAVLAFNLLGDALRGLLDRRTLATL
jgi:ABC-type dipeptide/oligopeptide/nickel transport system permease subunit